MKYLIGLMIGLFLSSTHVSAQNLSALETMETYKRLFVKTCMTEAKKQNVNADIKDFCNCSFEKFYARIIESGADIESDPTVLEVISNTPEYEKEVQNCLMGSISPGEVNTLFENEFMKNCVKSINKNKFMRKNVSAHEICECSFAKIKDGQYNFIQLGELAPEIADEYVKRISEECMKLFLENKGLQVQPTK